MSDAPEQVRHRSRQQQSIDPLVALGALPLVTFYLGYQWGTYEAILLSFAATVLVYVLSWRRQMIRLIATFGFIVAAGAAVAGLVLNNERAYLARDAGSDYLIAAIALLTVLVGRPLVGIVVRELSPSTRELLPLQDRVFVVTTLLLGLVNLGQGAVRTWMLLSDLSVGQYLVWSRVFGWPTTFVLLVVIAYMIQGAIARERELRGEIEDDEVANEPATVVVERPARD